MNYGKYTLLIEQIRVDLHMNFVCYEIHIAPKLLGKHILLVVMRFERKFVWT